MDKEISTNITVNDLSNIAKLIEAATQRGAWRANELVIVGELYQKVVANIKSAEQESTNS